ncbi:hypothetical protein OG455_14720 [Kitasatospora sp. NBC_01287]|uniref:hypothetical protein n=1 Tax=Kitasatospora sp. NBC_01287 TaxID=2903573 RepID=UPI002256EB10|nr:hypothetical protein [Kitasatospora sp. NBC_01287]MCX4746758.1 hypothetical protein [Kitasatospora sp. NBC_01287]
MPDRVRRRRSGGRGQRNGARRGVLCAGVRLRRVNSTVEGLLSSCFGLVERLTGVYKNMTRGVVALVFRCRPVGGAVRTSDESTAVRWLTEQDVRTHLHEVYGVRLLDALAATGSTAPRVRAHDGRVLIDERRGRLTDGQK